MYTDQHSNLHVIAGFTDPVKVAAALAARFPKDYFKLADGTYVLYSEMDPGQIALQLQFGAGGQGIVASADGFVGNAPTDFWAWVREKRRLSGHPPNVVLSDFPGDAQ